MAALSVPLKLLLEHLSNEAAQIFPDGHCFDFLANAELSVMGADVTQVLQTVKQSSHKIMPFHRRLSQDDSKLCHPSEDFPLELGRISAR